MKFINSFDGDLREQLDNEDDRNNETDIIYAIQDVIEIKSFLKELIEIKKKINIEKWPIAFNELEYILARAGADLACAYINNSINYFPKEQDHSLAT